MKSVFHQKGFQLTEIDSDQRVGLSFQMIRDSRSLMLVFICSYNQIKFNKVLPLIYSIYKFNAKPVFGINLKKNLIQISRIRIIRSFTNFEIQSSLFLKLMVVLAKIQ